MFFTYYKNFEEASLYHIQPPPPKKGIKSAHASFRIATYGVSINPSIIYTSFDPFHSILMFDYGLVVFSKLCLCMMQCPLASKLRPFTLLVT